nr:hypothetical protein HK105_000502 [Polyrhizophydium stewartii]
MPEAHPSDSVLRGDMLAPGSAGQKARSVDGRTRGLGRVLLGCFTGGTLDAGDPGELAQVDASPPAESDDETPTPTRFARELEQVAAVVRKCGADALADAVDQVMGLCADYKARIAKGVRSGAPASTAGHGGLDVRADVLPPTVPVDGQKYKDAVAETCRAILAKIDTVSATGSVADISLDIVKLHDSAEQLARATKQLSGSTGMTPDVVARFIPKSSVKIASCIVDVAKMGASYVPIPGLSVAISLIDTVLGNITSSLDGVAGLEGLARDLAEIRDILRPLVHEAFSNDVQQKCLELCLLLEEVRVAVGSGKESVRSWVVITGLPSRKLAGQVAEFRSRLGRIKEVNVFATLLELVGPMLTCVRAGQLLGYAVQVDSAVMLMHSATKLNIIDVKVDKIIRILGPQELIVRREDYSIAPKPIDISGSFVVYLASQDGQAFVIKQTRDRIDMNPKFFAQIKAQAEAWYLLDHPNLLRICGLSPMSSAEQFYVVRYIKHDLESLIDKAKVPIDMATKLWILFRVAKGLKYLHHLAIGAPIVHGSIDMRHIRVDGPEFKQVKLSPGTIIGSRSLLAKLRLAPHSAPEVHDRTYTPEPPLDVYAFAALALQILLDKPADAVLDTDKLKQPAGIDDHLFRLLTMCLFQDPAKRPRMLAVSAALGAAVADTLPKAVSSSSDFLTDIEVLCRSFPGWASDNEITTKSVDPIGDDFHVADMASKKMLRRSRLSWDEHHRLTSLWLDFNSFEGKVPSTLCTLPNLTSLDVSNNLLTCIPESTEDLEQLKFLCGLIRGNNLSEFPDCICELVNLEYLFIGGKWENNDRIKYLPSGIGKLKNLRSLNSLTELPEDIGDLKTLIRLDLSQNSIYELPPEIGHLKRLNFLHLRQLSILDLGYNRLTVLPREICEIESLQALILTDNHITSIPDDLLDLTELKYL